MYTWWALVYNDGGGIMRVTVQADSAYNATQMFKAMYGSRLINEAASLST